MRHKFLQTNTRQKQFQVLYIYRSATVCFGHFQILRIPTSLNRERQLTSEIKVRAHYYPSEHSLQTIEGKNVNHPTTFGNLSKIVDVIQETLDYAT